MPLAKSKVLSGLFFMMLLFSSPVHSANTPAEDFRPCTQSDLVGTWQLVGLQSATPIDTKTNPYFFRNQRFVFQEDGKVRHVTSTEPITEEWFQTMLLAPATSTFSVDQEGVLTIQKQSAPSEHCLCTYNLTDVRSPEGSPIFAVGDVLLTTKANDKIMLQRSLRKIPGQK